MKKIKFLLIGLLLILPFVVGITNVNAASKKINVYIFRGEGCPHCEEAIEWFEDTLSKDEEYKDLYKLVKYEVWYDEQNADLMDSVAKELGTSASGVPFIVVGDKYFSGFSAENSPVEIKKAIKDQYEKEDYQDVVAAVKKGASVNRGMDKGSILPIVIVSAIAVVVVLGLVFFTKEKE
jgi:glutaredoxin